MNRETLKQFIRSRRLYWERRGRSLAVVVPWDARPVAYHLADYRVDASVSGGFLEFRRRSRQQMAAAEAQPCMNINCL
jgi:hypothetical protein